MKLLISVLLILHGLIVAGQSAGSFGANIPNEVQNPSFITGFLSIWGGPGYSHPLD